VKQAPSGACFFLAANFSGKPGGNRFSLDTRGGGLFNTACGFFRRAQPREE
jgi:hypothetical protein